MNDKRQERAIAVSSLSRSIGTIDQDPVSNVLDATTNLFRAVDVGRVPHGWIMVTALRPAFSRRAAVPLIRLSWSQFVVIFAVAAALAAIVGIVLAPDLHERYARRAIKQFEGEFGFVTGTVVVSDPDGIYRRWGITTVIPDGRFARAGFRDGDVPFEYHGHVASWLYGALLDASRGTPVDVEVYNAHDAGNRALRRITIPASR